MTLKKSTEKLTFYFEVAASLKLNLIEKFSLFAFILNIKVYDYKVLKNTLQSVTISRFLCIFDTTISIL